MDEEIKYILELFRIEQNLAVMLMLKTCKWLLCLILGRQVCRAEVG